LFNLFKRKARLTLVELCGDGHCAVVGESFYQDALRATNRICTVGPDGRAAFTAALVPEPDNPYDANAIAIHSPEGKVGHLSRDAALEYQDLFAEITRRGYQGGACEAHLVGGEPGKPSFGVVLHLADPDTALSELLAG
jgi:hypothetical protein